MKQQQIAANLTNSMRPSNVGFQLKNKESLKSRRGVKIDTAGAPTSRVLHSTTLSLSLGFGGPLQTLK
jgi:hypothetical protein